MPQNTRKPSYNAPLRATTNFQVLVGRAQERGEPPAPFKRLSEDLESFVQGLSEKHVYITHIDSRPAAFKRKIFLVPVTMNVCVSLLFLWRMCFILPWYWKIVTSTLGYPNSVTFSATEASRGELAREVARRGLTMVIDYFLLYFIWPWPVRFAAGQRHGNPMLWRYKVGFRDREIYVRRSRDWDRTLGEIFKNTNGQNILTGHIHQVTSPIMQERKTGYLLMDGLWGLDWEAMVYAHALVDKNSRTCDNFRNAALVHHKDFGWLCYNFQASDQAEPDEQRLEHEFPSDWPAA